MSSDYIVREYREGDGPQIVDLLVKVFGDWPSFSIDCTKLEHLYWKGQENPLGRSFMVLVEHSGEIVAFEQEFVRITRILGNELVTGSAVDLAVHPEHRRRGLYNRMRERIFQLRAGNEDCTLANSGNKIVIDTAKRQGWDFFPDPIYYYVYINDLDLHQERHPSFGFKEKSGYMVLKWLKGRKTSVDLNYTVEEIDRFDSLDAHIANRELERYDFIQSLGEDYMNWRYADSRSGNHRITRIRENGETQGFMVSQINEIQEDYPTCLIQEMRAVDSEVAASLLEECMNFMMEHDVNYVRTVMPDNSHYAKMFTGSGFVNSFSGISVWFVEMESEHIINRFCTSKDQNIHLMPGIFDAL